MQSLRVSHFILFVNVQTKDKRLLFFSFFLLNLFSLESGTSSVSEGNTSQLHFGLILSTKTKPGCVQGHSSTYVGMCVLLSVYFTDKATDVCPDFC